MSESERSPALDFLTKQGAFIVSLLFFLFFSFATYSYNVTDAGWFYSGESGVVQNSMGTIGATLADILSAFFGSLFYTFPILFLAAATVCWRNANHLQSITYAGLISAGSLLYLCFGAVLCYLHSVGHDGLQYGHGGILGKNLGDMLYPLLGYDGTTLVSLALVLLAITLMTQLHWPLLLERVGKYCQMAFSTVAVFIRPKSSKKKISTKDIVGSALPETDRFAQGSSLDSFLGNSLDSSVDSSSDSSFDNVLDKHETNTSEGDGDEFDEPAFLRKAKSTGLRGLFSKSADLQETDALAESDDEWLEDDVGVTTRDKASRPLINRKEAKTEPTFDSFDGINIDDDDIGFTDTLYIDDAPSTVDRSPQAPSTLQSRPDEIFEEDQVSSDMLDSFGEQTSASTFPDNKQQSENKQPDHKPTVKTLSEAKQLEKIEPQDTGAAIKPIAAAYTLPDRSVLTPAQPKKGGYTEEALMELSALLELRLADFGVKAEVVEVNPGPVITRFEIQPAPGVKVSRITNLAKDLARSLSVMSVRVVEVIAGKSTIGIEIPNDIRDTVHFSEVINCDLYDNASSALTLSLGHDISGEPVVVDLAKMPHVLVAGTTGSGKSVGVNAMIMSMLLKSTPEQVRMIMVDPKMLELSVYEGIPHLLTPVITDMKDAANGLRWSVDEMERRYKLMSKLGVRNLVGFNKKVQDAIDAGSPLEDPLWQPEHEARFSEEGVARTVPHLTPLPYIVIVVDEFADMMMIVGKKVEELIARIAQKARAAGIHLILATQRPSVDVITGLIKANIPTRMAFQVSSKIDSRTILDQGGADQLLGQGDMLYLPAGLPTPIRVHGAFVSDEEVHAVVEEWKKRGTPEYINDVVVNPEDLMSNDGAEDKDALYDDAVKIVIETRKASISSIQRRLKIGYNRAANLVEAMEASGLVGPMGTNGQRDVLIPE